MSLPRSRKSRPGYPSRTALFAVAPLAVAALVLGAGCSSTPSTSGAASTSAAPTTSSGAANGLSADDEQAITNAFTTFFAASSPAATKLQYLQDASNFTATVDAQAGSGLATATTATVSGLLSTSPGQASVTYSILMDGNAVLPDQTGVAVQEDGTWKVAATTFCDLLTLENGGTPPAECVGVQLPGVSGESTSGAVATS